MSERVDIVSWLWAHLAEAEITRLRAEVERRRLTGEELEAADSPATWQDECADVEAAFERSGVRPTWPDDEPGNIGPMANAMADEIARLRDVVRQLTSSLLSRPLQSERHGGDA